MRQPSSIVVFDGTLTKCYHRLTGIGATLSVLFADARAPALLFGNELEGRRLATVTVENRISIAAPRAVVFRYVAAWQNAKEYVPNGADLTQVGSIAYGLGMRLRGRVSFAYLLPRSAGMDIVSEVVEFVEHDRIVCRSVKGVETSNTWLFAEQGGATILSARVTCTIPRGLAGRAVAKLLSRWMVHNLSASLANLKRILETSPEAAGA